MGRELAFAPIPQQKAPCGDHCLLLMFTKSCKNTGSTYSASSRFRWNWSMAAKATWADKSWSWHPFSSGVKLLSVQTCPLVLHCQHELVALGAVPVGLKAEATDTEMDKQSLTFFSWIKLHLQSKLEGPWNKMFGKTVWRSQCGQIELNAQLPKCSLWFQTGDTCRKQTEVFWGLTLQC